MRITKLNHMDCYPEELKTRLNSLGEFIDYQDFPTTGEALERLKNTDIAIVNWHTDIDASLLAVTASRLKYIVIPLTEILHVDVNAAQKYGIYVSNCANTFTPAVAEYMFALLGVLARKVIRADRLAHERKTYEYEQLIGTEFYGKTLGIFGLGNIGQYAAKIGQGYGMNVIAHTRSPKNLKDIQIVSLDTLLELCDFLFITVETNQSTLHILSRQKLELLKPHAFVVTVASPHVLDEDGLFELLEKRQIAGAGLDQLRSNSPLLNSDKVVLSDDLAWCTKESIDRLVDTICSNIKMYIDGNPINLVVAQNPY